MTGPLIMTPLGPKRMSTIVKGLKALDQLTLATEALELAEGVMSFCPGNAREQECTRADRNRFNEIYNQLTRE